jgi:hypothetical protein
LDWGAVAKTVIGAGIGTGAVSLYRDRRHRQSQASYMAMRLAATLEFYAYACHDFIYENRDAPHHPEEEFPRRNVKLPELPPYPDDAEGWQAINVKLVVQCLDFRTKIYRSQGIIHSTMRDEEDPNAEADLGDKLDQHAAALGLDAWNLAMALRLQHNVKMADPDTDLCKQLEEIRQNAELGMKNRNVDFEVTSTACGITER